MMASREKKASMKKEQEGPRWTLGQGTPATSHSSQMKCLSLKEGNGVLAIPDSVAVGQLSQT